MPPVPVQAGYDLPWVAGPLKTLVSKRLPQHGIQQPVQACWDASFYGLDRVKVFTEANDQLQSAVLQDCARGNLMEAYFIEKAGVSYAAKMTLLAQSAEERSLYALFCSEEAAHLDAIHAALGAVDDSEWQANPFLTLLQEIIEQGDRQTGQLIIQVVLEGWGLMHYGHMRDACTHPGLTALFNRIVADEAAHHGSGVHLLRDTQFSGAQHTVSADLLGQMLAMVQVGPALVAGTLERHLGGFTTDQRRRVYTELDSATHIRERLTKLRSCLSKVPAAHPILETLDIQGRFTVPSVEALV